MRFLNFKKSRLSQSLLFPAIALVLPAIFPCIAISSVITTDTIWAKEISVAEDILIPKGITLTIKAGTVVKVSPAETTKTDPEYISPLNEITVRGRIIVEGARDLPVKFMAAESGRDNEWAGIIVDGGEALIRNCSINGAESAIYLIDAALSATNLTASNNRHGITAVGSKTSINLKESSITANDYGITLLSGIEPLITGTSVTGNRKKDFWKEAVPRSPEHKKGGLPPPSPSHLPGIQRRSTGWGYRLEREDPH